MAAVMVEGRALTRAERIVARCLPSFADLVFVSVLLGALFGLQGRLLGLDGDAAWNLRIGTQILQHGLPRTEFMLGTTYGQPTLYFEWLAQVVYALALAVGGLNGVVALAASFVALELTLLFGALRRRGIPLALCLALTVVAAFLTTPTWTARAQHFSLLLTLLWSEAIWRYWRSGSARALWFFPLTMVLWVNLHGGFIGGIALLGTATAVAWLFPKGRGAANPRDLSLALGGALVATLLTPWGLALWPHIYEHLRNPLVLQNTKEFQSPDFHSVYGLAFLALLLGLAATWLWMARLRSGRKGGDADGGGWALSPLAGAMALVWTVLAMQSVRFVALWALVVLPILGGALTFCLRNARVVESVGDGGEREGVGAWQGRATGVVRGLRERQRRMEALDAVTGRGVWAGLALVVVLGIVLHGGAVPGATTRVLDAQWDASVFPVQAAERLHREGILAGLGFTTYTWGSYLDYALPEYHPFIDSRSDVYSEQLLHDYLEIMGLGPEWRTLLDRYGVRWALLPATAPLTQALALSGWSCVGEDAQGMAVVCRRGP